MNSAQTIEPNSNVIYDVIIIGAGPAGMTAAVYCLRKKMKVLLVTKDIGGQVLWTSAIENYMGFQYVTGAELSEKFNAQISQTPIAVVQDRAVCGLSHDESGVFLITCGDRYAARAVIVATGKDPRKLNVPGEDAFIGKGVAYCSICDAPLFKGRDVVVVGGGNSAITAAIDLTRYASKIYVVNVAQEWNADPVVREKLSTFEQVEMMLGYTVTEIHGDAMVTAVTLQSPSDGATREVAVNGVFVEIGREPNSDFVKERVTLNKNNEIQVDNRCATSMPGVFACGDVTDVPYKQIVIACGEGAKAALSAYEYVVLS